METDNTINEMENSSKEASIKLRTLEVMGAAFSIFSLLKLLAADGNRKYKSDVKIFGDIYRISLHRLISDPQTDALLLLFNEYDRQVLPCFEDHVQGFFRQIGEDALKRPQTKAEAKARQFVEKLMEG